jgi:hypothetical protein
MPTVEKKVRVCVMRRRVVDTFSTRATRTSFFDWVSVPGATLKPRADGFLSSVLLHLINIHERVFEVYLSDANCEHCPRNWKT